MDCEKASLLMMLSLDGTIDESDKIKLQKHMDNCEHCRQEYSLLVESFDLIDSMEEIEPPCEIEDLVMSKIDTHKYSQETKVITWILRITVMFSMIGGILAYLAFNNPAVFKEAIVSGVVKAINFTVLTLPGILSIMEDNFIVIIGVGIGILTTLLASILLLVVAEYYIVEKLRFNFRGGVK